jgi:hypothetical protein
MAEADLASTAPAFIEMAHRIVWATVASVDRLGRPRSRILHPIWTFDGQALTGWIGTRPTPLKRSHLAHSPYLSCNYWTPSHDTCVAECRAELLEDDASRTYVWDLFKNAPAPVGYDPSIVPGWDTATASAFAVVRLAPWRIRVVPGTTLSGQGGEPRVWSAAP